MAVCWSCDAPIGDGEVFCGCGAIQPPQTGADAFAVLGVPRQFAQDADELEKKYKDWTRKLHPDRFVKADARARRWSLERATQLNDAYKRLKDPARRAGNLFRPPRGGAPRGKKASHPPPGLRWRSERSGRTGQSAGG